MRFDRIMPAVVRGEVDVGLIIHESRFTYEEHGLRCIADLGQEWESATKLPLPLGVICARRTLPEEVYRGLEEGMRASVELAFSEPERSMPWSVSTRRRWTTRCVVVTSSSM